MPSLVGFKYEYDRCFSKAVIALAQSRYDVAKRYLEQSTVYLNELSQKMTGEEQDYTRDFVVDLLGEIDTIEQRIVDENKKKKANKTESEHAGCKHKGSDQNRFATDEVPSTTFDDIAGLEDVKETVMYKVIYPRIHSDIYDTFKKRTGGGILLYGLPGTGKTLIAEAIAHETEATFFPIKCSDLGSKWFGETEQNIRDVFDAARETENAVIFFDEIEAYGSNRRENSAMERSVPEFLAQMQGVGASEERNRILVIGATNKPWRLDGAFLRPGRFDEKIYVPLPCESARKQIIESRLDGVPNDGIDIQSFVNRTIGYNGADVDYLCEKAKENAIKRILKGENTDMVLHNDDFEKAFASIRSSVLDVDKQEMEKWQREYNGLV